jgi:hypothetical protein
MLAIVELHSAKLVNIQLFKFFHQLRVLLLKLFFGRNDKFLTHINIRVSFTKFPQIAWVDDF